MGLKNYNCTEKTGYVADVKVVRDDDDLLIIADDGTIIRTAASGVSILGRATQGVRLMRPNPGAGLISVAQDGARGFRIIMKKVCIYTDGACSGNPGPGGWAAILSYNGHERELSGGEPATTNNRMELIAAISALEALKEPCEVELWTDSQYLARAVNEGWLAGWKRRGWGGARRESSKIPSSGRPWTPCSPGTRSASTGSRATTDMSTTSAAMRSLSRRETNFRANEVFHLKTKGQNKFHRSDLAVFFSFFRPHIGLFALDMSCAVAVAVIDLAFPYITRISMQTLLPEKLYTTFFIIMAAMFAAYILKGFMYYLITVLGHRMGVYIEADMRHAVFNHMQKLSFSFFDKNRTGVLMSRITSDLFEITELAHHGPEDILISVLTILGSLVVLAGIEWRLALVLAVSLPLLILFTLSRRVSMKKANLEVKRRLRR